MPRIKIVVDVDIAGCDHRNEYDYDDDEWDAMTEEQQAAELEDLARDALYDHCSAWAEVTGPCTGEE